MRTTKHWLMTIAALLCSVMVDAATYSDWTSTNKGQSSTTSSNTYTITANAGEVLTFDWLVSSESNYDKLIITIGGTEILNKSGELSGTYQHTFTSSGTYTMVVKYTKDGSVDRGSDYAKVHNITLGTGDAGGSDNSGTDNVVASGTCGTNLTWKLTNEGELIIKGTGTMNDYSWYDDFPWYNNRSLIRSVTTENGVSSIGKYAFYAYANLVSVTISESVTSIGDYAFRDCSSLTAITIPEGVMSIGEYAFYGTEWYNNQPDGVVYAGSVAYTYKGTMPENTSIVIEEGTKSIASRAFYRRNTLSSITIPNSVEHIGTYAFADATGRLFVNCNIPSVNSSNDGAFSESNFSEVVFGDEVTSIGGWNFANCHNLTSIFISKSVTNIHQDAFFGCSPSSIVVDNDNTVYDSREDCNGIIITASNTLFLGFVTTIIPNSVTSIGDWAFEYCSSLTTITLPENVTSIGRSAFAYCRKLASVKCEAVEPPTLGTSAFYNIPTSAILYVPQGTIDAYKSSSWSESFASVSESNRCGENLTWELSEEGELIIAGEGAMMNYDKGNTPWHEQRSTIKKVTIGEGVTTVGSYAFNECENLVTITIPEGVNSIGNNALSGCSNLISINLPEGMTSIGESAFSGCSSLIAITMSESVTNVGNLTFSGCSSLSSIEIPRSVISIGNNAFDDCTSLRSVTFKDGNTALSLGYNNYSSNNEGQGLFYDCPVEEVYLGRDLNYENNRSYGYSPFKSKENLVNLSVGPQVTSIGGHAFSNCSSLSSITFPEESLLASIGLAAFSNCSNLTTISIPITVTSIGDYAFSNCSSLASITFPEESLLASIGLGAFNDCSSLTTFTITKGVISIGNEVFEGCSSLKSVIIEDSSIDLTLGYEYYSSYSYGGYGLFYYCPLENVYLGRNLTYSSGKSYGYSPFANKSKLTNLTIGNKVTSIEEYAFYGCSKLTSISIPEGVTSIGGNTFSGCSSLASITIPEGVTSIGESAFYNCSKLSSISIPEGVTSIGGNTFSGCSSLASITIPEGVTSIGESAFNNCSSLTSITIPETVTSIGNCAFYDCSKLTSITIPEAINSIGNYAFIGCSQLCDLFISSVKSWCSIQFGDFSSNPLCYAKNLYLNGVKVISLTIPESVTNINNFAFYGYDNLESIIIPKSVLSIGNSAFAYCKNLISITCESENPPSISSASFGSIDKSLCILYVPEASISSYKSANGWQEFSNILPLAEIVASGPCGENLTWEFTSYGELILDGQGDMYNYLSSSETPWHKYREEIQKVTINEGVTSIGDYAFMNCVFTSIVIPSSISSIGGDAFNNCSNLANITCKAVIPPTCSSSIFNNVEKSIPVYVPGASLDDYNNTNYWKDFTNINAIIIGSGSCETNLTWKLTDHGVLTIEGCGSLSSAPWPKSSVKHIVICDGVTYIGERIFTESNDLKSVIIPGSVGTIDYGAFSYCYNMESLILTDGITRIDDFAFYRCNKLTSLIIPKSVTYIGEHAFTGSNFSSIIVEEGNTEYNSGNGCNAIISGGTLIKGCSTTVIPSSVVQIGEGAFYSCQGLTSITIPDNVAYIEADAFQDCRNLSSLTIGAGLERIREFAFAGCTNLASITCYAVTPPSCDYEIHIFNSVNKDIPVYVPKASVEAYRKASSWNEFRNIKELPGSLTINQYGSATYCSEYALDFSEVEGLKAYAATGYNKKTGVVTLTRIMTSQPGMGLFLKGEQGNYVVPTIEESDDNSLNMLVGTLEKTTVNNKSDDGIYINYKYTIKSGDAAPLFYQFEDGSSLSAGKAYLQIPAAWLPAAEQKSISIRFDEGEGTTDIEDTEFAIQNSALIYDLMGRKVSAPKKGGIYIVNGKKVVY